MTEPWELLDESEKQKERTPLDDKVDEVLLQKRIIVLNGELQEGICDRICKRLIFLGEINAEPIKVILNSIGGEVYLGLLIFNTIKDLVRRGIEVTIETRGLAASMGCIVLQAGTKRTAAKASRFMIHELSTYSWGKSSDVKEQAEEAVRLNNLLREILAEKTGKSPEEIEKVWHKTDVYMSAKEALAFGLIDEIT